MDDNLKNIIMNIIGGFLASLLAFLFFWICERITYLYKYRNFKRIFGQDVENNFYIVYGKMFLPEVYDAYGKKISFPYIKLGTNKIFNISSPVSFIETKSAKYLTESFANDVKKIPELISDEDIQEKMDISYCSLGGYNNFKTIDILESEENTFFNINLDSSEIFVKNDITKRFQIDQNNDYAMIIKIIPKSFPNRTWIAVAGLGEWGTSGATWFLSKNWKKIQKIAKNKQFGFIVKVKKGRDESAEIVYKILK